MVDAQGMGLLQDARRSYGKNSPVREKNAAKPPLDDSA